MSRTTAIEQITRRVKRLHGDAVKLPSRATFFRLLEADERGEFTFGSAKTRESLALRPHGTFGTRTALRPGELVEMDSTRIDIMMRIDEKTIGRPELTILLDVATRSILAAMLRPEGTKHRSGRGPRTRVGPIRAAYGGRSGDSTLDRNGVG